jgi:hypothetical protein
MVGVLSASIKDMIVLPPVAFLLTDVARLIDPLARVFFVAVPVDLAVPADLTEVVLLIVLDREMVVGGLFCVGVAAPDRLTRPVTVLSLPCRFMGAFCGIRPLATGTFEFRLTVLAREGARSTLPTWSTDQVLEPRLLETLTKFPGSSSLEESSPPRRAPPNMDEDRLMLLSVRVCQPPLLPDP